MEQKAQGNNEHDDLTVALSEHRATAKVSGLLADTLLDLKKRELEIAAEIEARIKNPQGKIDLGHFNETEDYPEPPFKLHDARLKSEPLIVLRYWLGCAALDLQTLPDGSGPDGSGKNISKRRSLRVRIFRLKEEITGREKAETPTQTSAD